MFFNAHKKSEDEIKNLQLKKLKRLLKFTYKNSEFYKKYYDSLAFHPEEVKTYEDICKIPKINRNLLKETPDEKIVTRKNINNLHRMNTSGSSGIPITIYYNTFEKYKYLYSCLRAYFMAGTTLTSRTVALRDPVYIMKPTFYQKLGFIPYDYYDIYTPIDEIYEDICRKYKKIDIIKAYPTDLANLAYETRKKDNFPEVGLIYTDSEALDPALRKYIEDTFGKKVIDFYASVENGMIAFQTPDSDDYYVNEDCVLLESQKVDGLSENEGEVVITNLYNYTTPIIRYQIGDVIDFGDYKRDENADIKFRKIKQIHGKYLDFIMLPDKSIISPHIPKQDMTHIKGVRKFKLIQEQADYIRLIIQKEEGYTDSTHQEIIDMMNNAFKNLVKIDVEYVDELDRGGNRKFKVIESKVAQEFLSNG